MGGFLDSDRYADVIRSIGKINEKAYSNTRLLCNTILSRNIYHRTELRDYLAGAVPQPFSFKDVLRGIVSNYRLTWNAIKAFVRTRRKFKKAVGPQRTSITDDIVLVDNIVNVVDVARTGGFRDKSFPGFEEYLEKKGCKVVYTPHFVYDFSDVNSFVKCAYVLNDHSSSFICEYDLLEISDVVRIFLFAMIYPLSVARLIFRLRGETGAPAVVRSMLTRSLFGVEFMNYAKYLFGRRLADMLPHNVNLISWYENQMHSKCYYKGLREGANPPRIIGAQPFFHYPGMVHLEPVPDEIRFNVVPDRILVNGPEFLGDIEHFKYGLCPSFRYRHVFDDGHNKEQSCNLLVLLPLFKYGIEQCLLLLRELPSAEGMKIKFHPFTDHRDYDHLIPQESEIVDASFTELLKETRVMMGVSSGTIAEAVASGVPTIVVDLPEEISFNPLLELGRGEIWQEVSSAADFQAVYDGFLRVAEDNRENLDDLARQYRERLFTPVNDETTKAAFGI